MSNDRVKFFNTVLNKKTTINEYYYDIDLELSYINIFSNKDTISDRVYSIEIDFVKLISRQSQEENLQ